MRDNAYAKMSKEITGVVMESTGPKASLICGKIEISCWQGLPHNSFQNFKDLRVSQWSGLLLLLLLLLGLHHIQPSTYTNMTAPR